MSKVTDIYLSFNHKDREIIKSIDKYLSQKVITSLATDVFDEHGNYNQEIFDKEDKKIIDANSMVVFLGEFGISDSQNKMLELAYSIQAKGGLQIYACLLGKNLQLEDLPSALKGPVVYYYPKRVLDRLAGPEPSLKEIIDSVIKLRHPSNDATDKGDEEAVNGIFPDIPNENKTEVKRISQFKGQAFKQGASIVLGSNWYDESSVRRDEKTVKLITDLYRRKNISVDSETVMSLERAAYIYSILREEDQLIDELDGPQFGAPEAFRHLALLAKSYSANFSNLNNHPSGGPRSKKVPLIFFNTCLLYTSPSPRDQRGSRMPSSA